jgi:DNA-directed RNA polymerase specialized sigma24 family protein
MDEAERAAAVRTELPAVLAGLARRFPGTAVSAAEVERAAAHSWERDPAGAPQSADEVFAWLFGIAGRRHVMALVAGCRGDVRGRLLARFKSAGIGIDDVLQTAYLKAHAAIEDPSKAAGLPTSPAVARAWFGRIAENAALDAIKHHRRRQRLDGPLGDDLAAAIAVAEPTPAPAARLDSCVAGLPAAERQVAALFLTGQKPAAISKTLDRPVSWVYERIRTAKERLRRCLDAAEESDP